MKQQRGNSYLVWMMEPEDVADCVIYLLSMSSRVKIEEILMENFQSYKDN